MRTPAQISLEITELWPEIMNRNPHADQIRTSLAEIISEVHAEILAGIESVIDNCVGRDTRPIVLERIRDLFQHEETFSEWWDRTWTEAYQQTEMRADKWLAIQVEKRMVPKP